MFNVQKDSRVLIFAKTRMEWMLTALGVMRAGGTVGTLYTTMTQEAVANGLMKFMPDLIVVEAGTKARVQDALATLDQLKSCPILCLDEDGTSDDGTTSLGVIETAGTKVEVFSKIISMAKQK